MSSWPPPLPQAWTAAWTRAATATTRSATSTRPSSTPARPSPRSWCRPGAPSATTALQGRPWGSSGRQESPRQEVWPQATSHTTPWPSSKPAPGRTTSTLALDKAGTLARACVWPFECVWVPLGRAPARASVASVVVAGSAARRVTCQCRPPLSRVCLLRDVYRGCAPSVVYHSVLFDLRCRFVSSDFVNSSYYNCITITSSQPKGMCLDI